MSSSRKGKDRKMFKELTGQETSRVMRKMIRHHIGAMISKRIGSLAREMGETPEEIGYVVFLALKELAEEAETRLIPLEEEREKNYVKGSDLRGSAFDEGDKSK